MAADFAGAIAAVFVLLASSFAALKVGTAGLMSTGPLLLEGLILAAKDRIAALAKAAVVG